jgi:Domain of unknown function (DUF4115)
MPGNDQHRPSFNEQAALEELERLQRQIEESRRLQRQATDDFDAFVRSFARSPTPHPPGVTPAAHPAGVRAQPRTIGALTRDVPSPPAGPNPATLPPKTRVEKVEEKVEAETAERGPIPPPQFDQSVSVEGAEPSVIPAALAPASDVRPRRGVVLVVAVAALVLAIVIWRALSPSPVAPEPAAGQIAEPATPATVPTPTASPAPAPVPPAELTTSRRVWVRVMVDGERVIERELEANARVPLTPKRQIVIRAGDAGAVRLSIDGQDQGVFGQEGFPITKTFIVKTP